MIIFYVTKKKRKNNYFFSFSFVINESLFNFALAYSYCFLSGTGMQLHFGMRLLTLCFWFL